MEDVTDRDDLFWRRESILLIAEVGEKVGDVPEQE